jgi:FkbM family methyltransferase
MVPPIRNMLLWGFFGLCSFFLGQFSAPVLNLLPNNMDSHASPSQSMQQLESDEKCGLTTKVFFDGSSVRVCSAMTNGNPGIWDIASTKWEPITYRAFSAAIDSETSVIDFGSWIGVTALYSATRAKRVIALEPDYAAYKILLINQKLNIPHLPLSVFHACVSAEQVSVQMQNPLSIRKNSQAGGSASQAEIITDDLGKSNTGSVQCRAATSLLYDFGIEENSKVFIKIDTEGHEQVVVPALFPLYQRLRLKPSMLVSMHINEHQGRIPSPQERAGFVKTLSLYSYIFTANDRSVKDGEPTWKLHSGISAGDICDLCDYFVTDDEAIAGNFKKLKFGA